MSTAVFLEQQQSTLLWVSSCRNLVSQRLSSEKVVAKYQLFLRKERWRERLLQATVIPDLDDMSCHPMKRE